jgi:superoxide dismutase, Cu-Zn family
MRARLLLTSLLALVLLGAVTAIVLAQKSDRARALTITLRQSNGSKVGVAHLAAASPTAAVDVRVSVRRQQPGFHGFHIHAVGKCEGPSFMSAGGHVQANPAQSHGDHIGDMPSLLVKRNGTASLRFTTDRFDLGDLRDADGSAVMIHAGPDNFANIPPRYAPNGPDQQTKDTGDSGDRAACGAIAADRSTR